MQLILVSQELFERNFFLPILRFIFQGKASLEKGLILNSGEKIILAAYGFDTKCVA